MDSAPRDTTYQVAAGPEDAGKRLDRFLADALPGLSRNRIKALIEAGRVRLGGATVADPSHRVKPAASAEVRVPAAAPAAPAPQAMPLDVVYEDADLIVLDKPAGLVVHPAPGNPDRTLVNALLAHCGAQLSGIGGVRRPGIVHRLDKDTSGLMVAAKTEAAHAGLVAQFAAREVERAYLAVVRGVPAPRRGMIEGAIGRHPRDRKRMAVLSRGGRPARTRYTVLRAFDGAAALLECRLDSGRTHQIRVHLAARGHPLVGDPVYGGRRARGRPPALPPAAAAALGAFPRQALHARLLGFRHPVGGERLRFTREPPADMAALLAALDAAAPEYPSVEVGKY